MTPQIHDRGGTERCVLELAARWSSRFDITVYTMSALEDVSLTGVRWRRVPMLRAPGLTQFLYWVLANSVMRLVDKFRFGAPDVLYTPGVNCLKPDVVTTHIVFHDQWPIRRAAAQRRGVAGVARFLHQLFYWYTVMSLESLVYRRPRTALIAICDRDARSIEQRWHRPRGSIPVIRSGVDHQRFSPERRRALRNAARSQLGLRDETVFLGIGNDVWIKGFDRVIAAMAHVEQGAVLHLAGRIDSAVIEQLARASGVAGRVRILPHSDRVADYYAAADVFVAPSRGDTFPLPVLEALACGLPVVTTPEAGTSEVVAAFSSVVMTMGDDASELAAAMQDASLCQVGSESFGATMSWDRCAEETAAVIEDWFMSGRRSVTS